MPFDDLACFRLARIPVRPIHWLWRPYLACGKLALLDGDPGAEPDRSTADEWLLAAPATHAPDDAAECKADRPPSRAVSALRPWPAANPKR